VAAVAAAAVIAGVAGGAIAAAVIAVHYLLRRRERLCNAVTVGGAAIGLTLAGAVLSQNPWRSVDGYVGHSPWVQFLALVSVASVVASAVVATPTDSHREHAPGGEDG
jgi:arabinofuranan 3-O-arabinosyltransferase